jgi:hypothetical protein
MELSTTVPQRATELVSVWLCAVKWMLDLEELITERLSLTRLIVRRGFDHIKSFREGAVVGEDFLSPFREIVVSNPPSECYQWKRANAVDFHAARRSLRQSTSRRRTSNVSLAYS